MKKTKTENKRMKITLSFLCLALFCGGTAAPAQTGGLFQIENSVVASGGGATGGGNFSLEATAGQTIAGGLSTASPFALQNGFWTFNLAPTASAVTVGGRVLTADGQGIRRAHVMLTAPNGETRFSLTGSFGYYRFNDVPVGETYVLTVFSRRFVFAQPTIVVNVTDEFSNLDFVAAAR